ncbi:hypothetical protein [Stenotrophomonas sp. SY1]|uniref:hypothetical protein n=1 Tax=Stenotrophomonas sp. SY1 TaxID=477235 RepID=UPI001E348134|nr:hypothetical protein [Stenotrophomonas sp. SY1]MCD9085836.1 hypothetical protein [Stenotrophomonas sp. SY1]
MKVASAINSGLEKLHEKSIFQPKPALSCVERKKHQCDALRILALTDALAMLRRRIVVVALPGTEVWLHRT